jgi:hypothetical protein
MTVKALVRALVSMSFGLLMAGATHAAPTQWSGNMHWYEAVPWFVTVPGISSWEAANVAAMTSIHMGMTGHLATITSAGENAFISGLTPRAQASTVRPLQYMLGGFQDPTATTPGAGWQWVTGEVFSYTNWATDEPNNHDVGETQPFQEDRLGFWATANADGLTWNDIEGLAEPGYVIEWEPAAVIPEPETYALLVAGLGLLGFAARRRRSLA